MAGLRYKPWRELRSFTYPEIIENGLMHLEVAPIWQTQLCRKLVYGIEHWIFTVNIRSINESFHLFIIIDQITAHLVACMSILKINHSFIFSKVAHLPQGPFILEKNMNTMMKIAFGVLADPYSRLRHVLLL